MTYQRFQDVPVWQTAARVYELADELLEKAPPRLSRSARDQLERAVLSISNNIAEGFERGTTAELLSFLYIARGSAGEVQSMLALFERRSWMEACRPEIGALRRLVESCSRQLRSWADHLQNSPIRGQRYLDDATRERRQVAAAAERFRLDFLRRIGPSHPLYNTEAARRARGETGNDPDGSG